MAVVHVRHVTHARWARGRRNRSTTSPVHSGASGHHVEAVGTPIRHASTVVACGHGPRATRLAIQAGSVIQVSASKADRTVLELAPLGGRADAQGRPFLASIIPSASILLRSKAKLDTCARRCPKEAKISDIHTL